jgi:hypothetical protein
MRYALLLTTLLWGCAAVVPDWNTRAKLGKPAAQQYQVWSVASHSKPKECKGTTYALATRNRVVRLQVDGEEQTLNYSWRFDHNMRMGDQQETRYEFLDPRSGEALACRTMEVRCDVGFRRVVFKSVGGPCDWEPVSKEAEGDARLDVIAPHFISSQMIQIGPNQWSGAGWITVTVRVIGVLTEEYWCPAVQVEWPDQTRSYKESDCDPWDGRQARQSWKFTKRLPQGAQIIRVRLLRAGKVLTAAQVKVDVR